MKQPFNYLILRKLREWNKNQAWLSDMTGIDKTAISKYINGSRIPTAPNFLKICALLEIDPMEVRF